MALSINRLAQIVTFLLVVFNTQFSKATSYYVSIDGDDSHVGTSPNHPWRTIAKVNREIKAFAPADSLLFHRGQVFLGQLIVSVSGTNNAPIYIGAYGLGDNPWIKGTKDLVEWSPKGKNLWEAECLDCPDQINNLFWENKPQPLARYPNEGYLTISSARGKSLFKDSTLTFPNGYWNGAVAVVRSSRWTLDRLLIESQIGDEITVAEDASYNLKKKQGYFIQDHPSALDFNGEWSYDVLKKRIRLCWDSEPKSIQVSVHDYGIALFNAKHILVENLGFSSQAKIGVLIKDSDHFQMVNCEINHSGQDGLRIENSHYAMINSNLITDANNNGCEWFGSRHGIFQKNVIKRIGIQAGRGLNGNQKYNALVMRDFGGPNSHNIICDNIIDSVGYIGIDFRTGHTLIRKNLILNFCMVKDDGGGIYTYGNLHGNNRIEDNLIFNGIGAGPGTVVPTRKVAEGIYMDSGSSDIEIIGNKVLKCSKGLFIQDSNNIIIENNVLIGNNTQVVFKINKERAEQKAPNCLTSSNILIAHRKWQGCLELKSLEFGWAQFGTFKDNYMYNPHHTEVIGIQKGYDAKGGVSRKEKLTLANWESRSQASISNNSNHLLLEQTTLEWEASDAAYNELVQTYLAPINQKLKAK